MLICKSAPWLFILKLEGLGCVCLEIFLAEMEQIAHLLSSGSWHGLVHLLRVCLELEQPGQFGEDFRAAELATERAMGPQT